MTEEPTTGCIPVPEILELNHAFEGLAHPRRRYVLYSLQAETDSLLEDLAAKIAAWEGSAADTESSDDRVHIENGDASAEFTYRDYRVVVRSDGWVHVDERCED